MAEISIEDSRNKVSCWDDSMKTGATYAQKCIEDCQHDPIGNKLISYIRNAESLYRGDNVSKELWPFYAVIQEALVRKERTEVIQTPGPERNPILAFDGFDECLERASQFSAFLEGYSERLVDTDYATDGEAEGYAMAVGLLHDALRRMHERRQAELAAIEENPAEAPEEEAASA